jgi:small subunit ribosomal protein S17
MSEQAKTEAEAEAAGLERRRRRMVGNVVSDKMDKTIVVQVTRRFRHPKYKKYVNERVRYKAHDEENTARMGDRVSIIESRPLSKDKRWRLQSVLERAPVV